MATEKFSPWITVLVSEALIYFFSPFFTPVPVSLSDLSYHAIPSNIIFIVVFNHLKANVFKFFCVTYLQKFPLEKTKQTKEAQPNTYKDTHTYTTHKHTPNKQTKNLNKQFSFPPRRYLRSEGQEVAMCGSVPKAV